MSSKGSVKFHFNENEDDTTSLERIHTFNLKNEISEESNKKLKKKASYKSLRSLVNKKVFNSQSSDRNDML